MQKKKHAPGKRTYFVTHISVLALLTAIVLTANLLMTNWDSVMTEFFGSVGGMEITAQAGDFVSDYDGPEAIRAAQQDFNDRLVRESVVMLKNDDAALPLKPGAKLGRHGIPRRPAS